MAAEVDSSELFDQAISLADELGAFIEQECRVGTGVDPEGPAMDILRTAFHALTAANQILAAWEPDEEEGEVTFPSLEPTSCEHCSPYPCSHRKDG